jgi:hypothetical protein
MKRVLLDAITASGLFCARSKNIVIQKISYYLYDNFNRLLYVKDHDGNILSANEYHYKN